PLIDARLAEYPRLTAVRLFEEARAAGYGGSYNDVKRHVRKVRPRPPNARLRIAAQLDTLRDAGVRHAVLGASGCGAFRNPATEVAAIYRQEIGRRRHDFSVVAFAIFAAGCGPSNYEPFAEVLQGACLEKPIGGWVTGPLLQAESLLQVIIDSERRGVAPPPQRRQRAYPRHLPDPLGLWGWRSVLSRSISRSLGCEPAYSAAREAKPSPRGSTPRGLEQPVSVAAPVLPRSGPSSSQRRP
ncbi:MAG TPA: hypothetical protein VLA09_00315, partial [Longimicrobiales bacterium]|nr:hypothetical protein [Longimicrobiales bacterium]